MGLSNESKINLLDNDILSGNRYVALFSTVPDDDGAGGVELSGSGYVRILFTDWTAAVEAGNVVSAENNTEIAFAAASGAWVTIVGAGLYTELSGGTFKGAKALTANKDISSGEIFRIAAGSFVLQVT